MPVRSAEGKIDIWTMSLKQPKEAVSLLRRFLTGDEISRADRFAFPDLRDNWMVARGWVRRVLSEYTGAAPSELRFTYSVRGKPSLDHGAQLGFNVSHSHDRAILAVSNSVDLGVDIEHNREIVDYELIVERFYHRSEADALSALPSNLRLRHFFQLWALKESCMKATGLGLALPPQEIVFDMPVSSAPRLCALHQETKLEAWQCLCIDDFDGFSAALSYRGPEHEVRRMYVDDNLDWGCGT